MLNAPVRSLASDAVGVTLADYRPAPGQPSLDDASVSKNPSRFTVPVTPVMMTAPLRRGDTMLALLNRAGVAVAEALDAVRTLGKVADLKGLRPGDMVEFSLLPADADGNVRLAGLSLPVGPTQLAVVTRDAETGEFSPIRLERNLRRVLEHKSGAIQSSLYQAGVQGGVPPEVMLQVFRIFSYDVDFQRDIQPGDRFDVLYDAGLDEAGQRAQIGTLRYAALTLSGTTLRLYRFDDPNGTSGYYNERGENTEKALLRTPVNGATLTSGFGMRMHPLLGYSRMHRGVDFGAPSGTPVMAAGDGIVDVIERDAGYGNYIRLDHADHMGTAYAHLRGFASGLHEGSRVRQGQVIGYVGATGLATGPHLHYEVLVAGNQVNPLSVKLASHRKLDGLPLRQFRAVEEVVDRQLRQPAGEETIVSLVSARVR